MINELYLYTMVDGVKTNYTLVDVETTDFPRVLLSPFFGDINKLKNNGTYTVKLPLTAVNKTFFEYCNRTDTTSELAYSYIYADYYHKTRTLFEQATVHILDTAEAFEVQFTWGMSREKYNRLFDRKLNEISVNHGTIQHDDWMVNWKKEDDRDEGMFVTGKKYQYIDYESVELTSDVNTVNGVTQPKTVADEPIRSNQKYMGWHPYIQMNDIIDLINSDNHEIIEKTCATKVDDYSATFNTVTGIKEGDMLISAVLNGEAIYPEVATAVTLIESGNKITFDSSIKDIITASSVCSFEIIVDILDSDVIKAKLTDKGLILNTINSTEESNNFTIVDSGLTETEIFTIPLFSNSIQPDSKRVIDFDADIFYISKFMMGIRMPLLVNMNISFTIDMPVGTTLELVSSRDGVLLDMTPTTVVGNIHTYENIPYTLNITEENRGATYSFVFGEHAAYTIGIALQIDFSYIIASCRFGMYGGSPLDTPVQASEPYTVGHYDCLANMPDMTQMEFLTQIAAYSGLFIGFDSERNLKWYSLDLLTENIEDDVYYDWSNKVSGITKNEFTFNDFAQRNYFRFANDKDLENRADYIDIQNVNLEISKDIFTYKFDSPLGKLSERGTYILYEQKVTGDSSGVAVGTQTFRLATNVNPAPPYNVGDIWITGSNTADSFQKVCITARLAGDTFHAEDWEDTYIPRVFSGEYGTDNAPSSALVYHVGDLWLNASCDLPSVVYGVNLVYVNEGLRCNNTKLAGATMNIDDWVKITNNEEALEAFNWITDFSADDKITPKEKESLYTSWIEIVKDGFGNETTDPIANAGLIIQQAFYRERYLAYPIQYGNYKDAYSALDNYLNVTLTSNSVNGIFSDRDTNKGTFTYTTEVDRTTWNTKWQNYFNAKKVMDNLIDLWNRAIVDRRNRTFLYQPGINDEYDPGDLWLGVTGEIGTRVYDDDTLKCITAKKVGEAFNINHWDLANKSLYSFDFNLLGEQIDKKAETFYQEELPHPIVIEVDNVEYAEYFLFVGDLWYKISTKETFIYKAYNTGTNNEWTSGDVDFKWSPMEIPVEMFDLIDGKKSVFLSKPINGYKERDLWLVSANDASEGLIVYDITGNYLNHICSAYELLVAINDFDTVFKESDWKVGTKYTDDTAVNNLVLGGKNFLKNSNFSQGLDGTTFWEKIDSTAHTKLYNEGTGNLPSGATNGIKFKAVNGGLAYSWASLKLNTGDTFTLSFWIKADSTYIFDYCQTGQNQDSTTITTSWQRVIKTFVATNNDFVFYVNGNTGNNYIYLSNVQLESGNKASDWNGNYDDKLTALDYLQEAMTDANGLEAIGGLLLAKVIQVRGTDGIVRGGFSGLSTDDLLLWGGTYQDALDGIANVVIKKGGEFFLGGEKNKRKIEVTMQELDTLSSYIETTSNTITMDVSSPRTHEVYLSTVANDEYFAETSLLLSNESNQFTLTEDGLLNANIQAIHETENIGLDSDDNYSLISYISWCKIRMIYDENGTPTDVTKYVNNYNGTYQYESLNVTDYKYGAKLVGKYYLTKGTYVIESYCKTYVIMNYPPDVTINSGSVTAIIRWSDLSFTYLPSKTVIASNGFACVRDAYNYFYISQEISTQFLQGRGNMEWLSEDGTNGLRITNDGVQKKSGSIWVNI